MEAPKVHTIEVWAQLLLCDQDCARIGDFLASEFGIRRSCIVRNMHITVYHARRPMLGVTPLLETVRVVLPTAETRFMILAPGGENPRPELDPSRRKVGVRVHRQSDARRVILEFRARLLQYESARVLGVRAPSTGKRNAFGARYFQPHMAILGTASGIGRDLKLIGVPFRKALGELTFDRFAVYVENRSPENKKRNRG